MKSPFGALVIGTFTIFFTLGVAFLVLVHPDVQTLADSVKSKIDKYLGIEQQLALNQNPVPSSATHLSNLSPSSSASSSDPYANIQPIAQAPITTKPYVPGTYVPRTYTSTTHTTRPRPQSTPDPIPPSFPTDISNDPQNVITFTPMDAQEVMVGDTVTFTIQASDTLGKNLTYAGISLPTGSTFDPYTQTFSWKANAAGTYIATFAATDGVSSDHLNVTIIIDVPYNTDIGPTPGDSSTVVNSTPSLAISSIIPSVGATTTQVTISGTDFTATGNTILFDTRVAAQNVASTDGTTLIFTVPAYLTPYCDPGMMCPSFASELLPGTYSVTVKNANGTSNAVQFTVSQ